MSDYSSEIASAKADIEAAGRAVVLRTFVTVGTAYDPARIEVNTDAMALQTKAKKSEYDRGLITATSRVYLFPADAAIVKDMKIIDGTELSITSIEPLQPGEGIIFYRVIANG